MNNLDFIYKRKSVRKYTENIVSKNDLIKILKAATHAPSGKNLQNWHFVVVRNKEKIQELAVIIEDLTNKIAEATEDADAKKGLLKYLKYFTFFKDAPILILVFASPYPNDPYDILVKAGLKEEADRILYASSGIQNIGAAMENLLLAAANLGYGTCWIAGPVYAGIEIEKVIGFNKEGYKLVAMTPLGVPEKKEQQSPPRKALEDVVTFID